MRRLIFSLVCLCSIGILYAGKPVTVKSGSVAALKNPALKAIVEVDYSATKIEGKLLDAYLQSRGDDFVRDWPRDAAAGEAAFRLQFNKSNKKGMQLTTDESAAGYKLVIRVKTLDMGNSGSWAVAFALGGSKKAGGCIIVGTIDIIEIQSEKVVCKLYIDEIKGQGKPSETARLEMVYTELAKKIGKLK